MNVTKSASQGQQTEPNAWRKFFATPLIVTNIAANGGVAQVQFQPADAEFWILQLTSIARDTGAVTVVANPKVSVQFTDSGSSYPLFGGNPVQLPNITGNATLPFVLPLAYILGQQFTITAQFTNNEAVALDIELALIGFKQYQQQA